MKQHIGIIVVAIVLALAAGFVAMRALAQRGDEQSESKERRAGAVAVEVTAIESGLMQDVRILSGSLEARARFTVAAKVDGLIESMLVDIGDEIQRGQVVAEIDDAKFVQAVAQAEAELAVREAELARSESAQVLAERDYERALALQQRGIASEAQVDETSAALETAKAEMQLSKARVLQGEAALELAKIELGYAAVRADWTGGPDTATVAERFQDAGNTVQSGDSIVSIVALDPLTAVVSVTESDYVLLNVGQKATLTTDARPGKTFDCEIVRIAPVFRESSRQARVEMRVENPERSLRPGMFIRVRVVLREVQAESIVPAAAVIERGGRKVIYIVKGTGENAVQRAVETGIVQNDRVQIVGESMIGRVVVLGQQLLDDGSAISIRDDDAQPAGPDE